MQEFVHVTQGCGGGRKDLPSSKGLESFWQYHDESKDYHDKEDHAWWIQALSSYHHTLGTHVSWFFSGYFTHHFRAFKNPSFFHGHLGSKVIIILLPLLMEEILRHNGINYQPQLVTLPETNIAHEIPIFPGKYHQNGGFFMAISVSGSVSPDVGTINSIILESSETSFLLQTPSLYFAGRKRRRMKARRNHDFSIWHHGIFETERWALKEHKRSYQKLWLSTPYEWPKIDICKYEL